MSGEARRPGSGGAATERDGGARPGHHHLVHRELLTITANGTGGFDFTTKLGTPLERRTRPPRRSYLPPSTARRTDRRVPLRT